MFIVVVTVFRFVYPFCVCALAGIGIFLYHLPPSISYKNAHHLKRDRDNALCMFMCLYLPIVSRRYQCFYILREHLLCLYIWHANVIQCVELEFFCCCHRVRIMLRAIFQAVWLIVQHASTGHTDIIQPIK